MSAGGSTDVYNGNVTFRTLANNLYDRINSAGDITWHPSQNLSLQLRPVTSWTDFRHVSQQPRRIVALSRIADSLASAPRDN